MLAYMNLSRCMLAVLLVGGCATSQDVSNDPRYSIGYAPGQVYRLKANTSIITYGSDLDTCRLESDDALASLADLKPVIVQSLPAGSRIRIDRLVREIIRAPIQGESCVEVFATPLERMCRCRTLRLGNSLSRYTVVNSPDSWPTMIGAPDPAKLTLERADTAPKP
jgi:hypothetical protein